LLTRLVYYIIESDRLTGGNKFDHTALQIDLKW